MKKKVILLPVCLLICVGFHFGQTGYVVAGDTHSYTHGDGDSDFLIYKLAADGDKQWRRNLGGIEGEGAKSIRQTSDGGYVVAGGTCSYTHGTGDGDFLIYKLDADGEKQWRKNLGGTASEAAESIRQTADGGYVVAGWTNTYTHGYDDCLVYKLDASGKKQWRKNYGGIDTDWAESIQQTSDKGYVVAGASWTYSNGSADILVYKLSSAGGKQWRKNFGGYTLERSWSIWQTSDGGYVTAGVSFSYNPDTGEGDFIVYKLNADGIKQWRKNYGGPLTDSARSIQETN